MSDEDQTPDVSPGSEDAPAAEAPVEEPAAEEPAADAPADAPAEEPAAEGPPAEEIPAEVAEEPVNEAPAAEEQPPQAAPAAPPAAADQKEEPVAEEPAASDESAPPVSESEPEGSEAEVTRASSEAPAEGAEGAPVTAGTEAAGPPVPQPAAEAPQPAAEEDIPETPRQKPEIPGLELEPDIVSDASQYLDAEAQAAAEAEAEAAAARARAEAEDEQSRPIAEATIDLASGARYTATGKRKTAVARVIIKPGAGEYSINGKALDVFFPRETLQRMIRQPLESVGYESRMDVVARMHGGGVSAQAGALRHGISRALIEADPNLRGELKRRGFLTRDPRVKERKKAGLKKARKRPQFSKR